MVAVVKCPYVHINKNGKTGLTETGAEERTPTL